MKTNVFILGAGFSAGIGVPVMSNFIQKAREYYFKELEDPKNKEDEENKKKFNKVENYIANISCVRNYLDVDLHNIENLYSLIDIENKIGIQSHELLKAIKYYIWKTIEYFTPGPHDNKCNIKQYVDFVKHINDVSQNNNIKNIVITFNYDLVFEYTIIQFRKSYKEQHCCTFTYPGYDNKRIRIYDSNYKRDNSDNPYDCFTPDINHGVIKIIKLHGSINWIDPKKKEEVPIIIPPSWRKGEMAIFDGIWRYAYESIKEANDIYFIGYSLPETDTYFKNLLAVSLSKSKKLKRVIVVNSDNSGNTEGRYRKLIDSNFGLYRDGLQYYSESFDAVFSKLEGLIAED